MAEIIRVLLLRPKIAIPLGEATGVEFAGAAGRQSRQFSTAKQGIFMHGFLGTRASLMLDVVFLAMFAVIPIMGWSIWLVKYQQKYALHKKIQLLLGGVLLVTVVLFEVDIRLNGWQHLAKESEYFHTWVFYSLYIHLAFAVTTALLWVVVIVQGLRNFPKPPMPCAYSSRHIIWGKLAAIDMLMTAITGWVFYWLAFVS